VQLAKFGIRKLLQGACGLPDIPYWRYASRHFMFLWNRTMVSKYTGKTPYEALHGKKPTCERWGVFGCDVEYHVPKGERLTTFSRTMEPGFYLGHDPARNCPAIYCLATGKVIYTRDVRYLTSSFEHVKRVVDGDSDGSGIAATTPEAVATTESGTQIKPPNPRHPPGLPLDSAVSKPYHESTSEEVYEVEQIVDHRTRRGKKEYQVKWVGYPIEQSTWQSKIQLIEDGCKKSIDRYEAVLRGEVIDDDPDEEVVLKLTPEPEAKAESEPVDIGTDAATNASNPIDLTDEEEAIRHALSDDHNEVAIRQAQIAMSAFSSGYAEPPHSESDSRRRVELACAIAASTTAAEVPTPRNYREAIAGPNAREWLASMDEEWNTLQEQGAWVYIKRSNLPLKANVLPSKFVYRVKLTETGAIDKYKSRLCPGGHRQKYGIDYDETFFKRTRTGKLMTMFLFVDDFQASTD